VKLSEYEKGYLEAAIDGEGSIRLRKQKRGNNQRCTYTPEVSITSTNEEFLWKIAEICGNTGTWILKEPAGRRCKKDYWMYFLSSDEIRNILPQLDGLVVKREHRKLILEFYSIQNNRWKRHRKSYTDEEYARIEEIYWKLRELNGGV